AGHRRTLDVATIAGWQAAIELVAAELHARLDQMVAYCASQVPPVPTDDETRRRYLSYVRFNNTLRTAKQHADDLANRVTKAPAAWIATPPPEEPASSDRQRFNVLQRIAVAQWQEAARVYR